MAHKSGTSGKSGTGCKKCGRFRGIVMLAAAAVAAVAIAKEVRKPAEERTWNGAVLGVVPYDFRRPTFARIEERFWNPEGESYIGPRICGVGWTFNCGKILKTLFGARG
jgi:hypothetical protein